MNHIDHIHAGVKLLAGIMGICLALLAAADGIWVSMPKRNEGLTFLPLEIALEALVPLNRTNFISSTKSRSI